LISLADVAIGLAIGFGIIGAASLYQLSMLRRLDRLTRALGVLMIQESSKIQRAIRREA
jgi:hypothetical protein